MKIQKELKIYYNELKEELKKYYPHYKEIFGDINEDKITKESYTHSKYAKLIRILDKINRIYLIRYQREPSIKIRCNSLQSYIICDKCEYEKNCEIINNQCQYLDITGV